MNCRRVEKLIPLYVEGDLKSDLASPIASHLDWCGRCNWLADEYKESQCWLRSSEPPEFDEATLNGLKSDVLRKIAESSVRPSLLASLMQQWGGRQVFALSTAMLFIFGAVVFYIYQARMSVKPSVVERAKQTPERESPPSNVAGKTSDTGPATGAGLSGRQHHKSPANIKGRAGTPIISEQTFEPPFVSQTSRFEEPGAVSAVPAGALPGSGDDPPEMLRIEIQTNDPNIRIIWFAPKEVESPKTNQ